MPVRAVSKTFPLLFVLKWGKKKFEEVTHELRMNTACILK